MGFWNEFMDYSPKQIEFIGVEAGGPKNSKLHAAPLSNNAKIGILHGAKQYVMQTKKDKLVKRNLSLLDLITQASHLFIVY